MRCRIKWAQGATTEYLYGSILKREGHRVVFDNPLMSPGFPIVSWNSKTNFQAQRKQPHLPLLTKGKRYQVTIFATVEPKETVYARIIYYNRFDEEIGTTVLKEDNWSFVYPKEAFSYKLELLNAGCHRLEFEALEMMDEVSENEWDSEELTVYFSQEKAVLHVVFLEPNTVSLSQLPMEEISTLGNVLFVGGQNQAASFYMDKVFEEKLKRYVHFCREQGLSKVRFIAYGPVGNVAVLYYSSKIASQGFVTAEQMNRESLERVLEKELGDVPLSFVMDRHLYAQNVTTYGQIEPSDWLDLVEPLFRKEAVLKRLPIFKQDHKEQI